MGLAERLSGGDPRTLGPVDEVVGSALADPEQLHELFRCLFADDQIVRMRAADALEKVARQQPVLLVPYVDRLLAEVAPIEQPSVQWSSSSSDDATKWDGASARPVDGAHDHGSDHFGPSVGRGAAPEAGSVVGHGDWHAAPDARAGVAGVPSFP